MKGLFLVAISIVWASLDAYSQTIPSRIITNNIKGKTDFYITSCEQFYSITGEHNYYENRNLDSCSLPFWKYDLKGTFANDSIHWEFISPKKYTEIQSYPISIPDSIQMYIPSEPQVITSSEDWALFLQRNEIPISLKIDFNVFFVVFENVWLDCRGSIKHRIEFDPIEKKINCNRFSIYGGSRGMCTKPNLILVKKPIANPSIEVIPFYIR
jgi:hypothetical protein